ncbi:UvrB/UvrC motif-containing protein [bacterium]|nr:UvrB/UvrC motif-containing protein [bacterium]
MSNRKEQEHIFEFWSILFELPELAIGPEVFKLVREDEVFEGEEHSPDEEVFESPWLPHQLGEDYQKTLLFHGDDLNFYAELHRLFGDESPEEFDEDDFDYEDEDEEIDFDDWDDEDEEMDFSELEELLADRIELGEEFLPKFCDICGRRKPSRWVRIWIGAEVRRLRVCEDCIPGVGVEEQMRFAEGKSASPDRDVEIPEITKLFEEIDLTELYLDLQEAIEEERYEDAAIIRDLIRRIEEKIRP